MIWKQVFNELLVLEMDLTLQVCNFMEMQISEEWEECYSFCQWVGLQFL